MTVRLDVSGMMARPSAPRGSARRESMRCAARAADCVRRRRGAAPPASCRFRDLPQQTEALERITALAREVRDEVDTLVVLGIGGSALGSRAILSALGDGTGARRWSPTTSIRGASARLLDGLDLTRTAFNVVSKSGETAETMAQFLIVRDRLLRALGAIDYKPRVIITTDAEHGSLRQIVNDEGFRDLVVPAGVGGRFSVLTAAGLVPRRRRPACGSRICSPAPRGWISARAAPQLWENPAPPARRRCSTWPRRASRKQRRGADAVQRSPARPRRAGSPSCGRRAWASRRPRGQPGAQRGRRRSRRSAPPTSTRSCSSTSTGRPTRW